MEPTASHLAKQNAVHDKQQLSSQRSNLISFFASLVHS